MPGQKVYLLYVLFAGFVSMLLMGSCTNDLKKIQEVSAAAVKGGADTTRGVDILFSDSAKVKARLTAPLVLDYSLINQNKEQYRLMPKGVKIIMFDKNHQEEFNVVADTAYYYDLKRVVKFYKKVAITRVTGDVFRSEELIWDMNTRKIWSTKDVDFQMANGNHGHGTSMDTNESFYPLNMTNSTGLFNLDSKFGQ
jgi:LPS export ABC transporter protein LptC